MGWFLCPNCFIYNEMIGGKCSQCGMQVFAEVKDE